jgi:hypothetical protein
MKNSLYWSSFLVFCSEDLPSMNVMQWCASRKLPGVRSLNQYPLLCLGLRFLLVHGHAKTKWSFCTLASFASAWMRILLTFLTSCASWLLANVLGKCSCCF